MINVWQPDRGYSRGLSLVGAAIVSACTLVASPARVSAQDSHPPPNTVICTVQEVAVWSGSRIHIRCKAHDLGSPDKIYFAFPTADPDSSRMMTLATSALVGGKLLGILYDPADPPPSLCRREDCRRIQAVFLLVKWPLEP
jgi:hypothetical protein